jgi:hypothetical protein
MNVKNGGPVNSHHVATNINSSILSDMCVAKQTTKIYIDSDQNILCAVFMRQHICAATNVCLSKTSLHPCRWKDNDQIVGLTMMHPYCLELRCTQFLSTHCSSSHLWLLVHIKLNKIAQT